MKFNLRMMWVSALLLFAHPTPSAVASMERVEGTKIIKNCAKRAQPDKCRWRRHRLVTIRPHVSSFLGPTGACESGTGSINLRVGLRAYNPAGYYGRYQFGLPDWSKAGGSGIPTNGSWLEQAYRAVRWLHINGRDSWPNC